MCALDTALQRKVALKTLKFDDGGGRSLQQHPGWQEALTLARFNHPNIVSIHEIYEDHTTAYLVTEFVAGETLGKRLTDGPLDFGDAVTLMLKLADGLRGVHAEGIVHADIKPDNIMIREDGEPVLVDFGIAREAASSADETVTLETDSTAVSNKIEGTLAYMAPEVLRGESPTAQSDIFSLGTVLYEMLSGDRAFKQATEAGTMHAVLTNDPRPLHKLCRTVPGDFSDLVRRMMERDPARRPESMQAVYTELHKWSPAGIRDKKRKRRTLGAGIVAVLLITGALLWRSALWTPPTTVSGLMAKGLDGLKATATAEHIETSIDAFQQVLLRAPDNAAATAGLSLSLGRKYIFGERSPALLEQATALAESAVARDHQLALSHVAQARVLEFDGQDAEAEKAYQTALQLDPSNFFAFRGYGRFLIKRNDMAAAEDLFTNAIKYHPAESSLFDLLGRVYFRQQKYDQSRKAFRDSLALSPDNVYAYASLSATHYMQDDTPTAIAVLQQGLQVRKAAALYNNLGTYYFALGQYPQSADAFERALALTGSGDDYRLWANLADAYRATPDQQSKAVAAYRQALRILAPLLSQTPTRPDLVSRAALYHAKAGDFETAQSRLTEAIEQAPEDATLLYRAAVTSEILGKRTEALDFTRAALTQGYPISVIKADPELAALRQDKAFLNIVLSQGTPTGG